MEKEKLLIAVESSVKEKGEQKELWREEASSQLAFRSSFMNCRQLCARNGVSLEIDVSEDKRQSGWQCQEGKCNREKKSLGSFFFCPRWH